MEWQPERGHRPDVSHTLVWLLRWFLDLTQLFSRQAQHWLRINSDLRRLLLTDKVQENHCQNGLSRTKECGQCSQSRLQVLHSQSIKQLFVERKEIHRHFKLLRIEETDSQDLSDWNQHRECEALPTHSVVVFRQHDARQTHHYGQSPSSSHFVLWEDRPRFSDTLLVQHKATQYSL